jgi:hypothetical protein
MRNLILSLAVAAIPTLVLLQAASGGIHNLRKPTVTAARQQPHPATNSADPPGTINGAVTPQLIPDRVAYILLLRLIADRPDSERGVTRDYIRHVGLGRQDCLDCPETAISDDDIDALLITAKEFQRRVEVLDAQAQRIKDENWPNPSAETMARLAKLERQHDAISDEIIASLPRRLSAGGLIRLRQHVAQRMKRNIKIYAGAVTPPGQGGEGWQPIEHSHQH